jgi:RND family efflux transporter MFP subunit
MNRPIGASALGLILLLANCSSAPEKATSVKTESAPVAVRVVTAGEQAWPVIYEATGTVRAANEVVISSKWMGHVREVNVQVGSRVRAGQSLVVLDTNDLDASLRRAEAAVAQVRGAAPAADSAIAAAKANLDLAEATYRRMQGLFEKKSVSNQEYDEVTAKWKASQANYEMARTQRAEVDLRAAEAQQGLRSAQVARGYAELIAPFEGLVTQKSVEVGGLAAPGAPLLTIEREGTYRLEAQVEESRLASIRVGQPVRVQVEGLDREVDARVAEIVPTIDSASRSFLVKVGLPRAAASSSPAATSGAVTIRSGTFGKVLFAFGSRKALVVPTSALVERGQLQSVLVNEGGTARIRLVTIGERTSHLVEILSGLSAGESVISPVPASLADGTRLEVRP